MIGGLTSSLVLTLFIVPVMYAWIAPNELSEPTPIEDDSSKQKAAPAT